MSIGTGLSKRLDLVWTADDVAVGNEMEALGLGPAAFRFSGTPADSEAGSAFVLPTLLGETEPGFPVSPADEDLDNDIVAGGSAEAGDPTLDTFASLFEGSPPSLEFAVGEPSAFLGSAELGQEAALDVTAGTAMAQYYVQPSALPTVVHITTTYANGAKGFGTGVMVGRNDVLTAAHVVHNAKFGDAVSVVVTPSFNPATGNGPFGSYKAVDVKYDPGYATGGQFNAKGEFTFKGGDGNPTTVGYGTERDVAWVSLNVPLGDKTGVMVLNPNFKDGVVNQTGYPGVKGHNMTNDQARAADVDNYVNIQGFETHPGNSGGPLWYAGADGKQYVVGLVSTGSGSMGGAAYDVANHYQATQNWIASNDHLMVA